MNTGGRTDGMSFLLTKHPRFVSRWENSSRKKIRPFIPWLNKNPDRSKTFYRPISTERQEQASSIYLQRPQRYFYWICLERGERLHRSSTRGRCRRIAKQHCISKVKKTTSKDPKKKVVGVPIDMRKTHFLVLTVQ